MEHNNRRRVAVIGTPVDVIDWHGAIRQIAAWGHARQSRCVSLVNAHSAVTARFDAAHADALRHSDLATADGAPVAWMLRQLGAPAQVRLNGPDLMWRYLAAQAPAGGKVFFYGGSASTLALLCARVAREFPGLEVVGAVSPPFRALTPQEDADDVARINASGAHVVFVGLGCPKQEAWMAAHRGRIHAVMVGVGAAFDYHAGVQQRAPAWMQRSGLEWAHRLATEPRRLWRRYLVTNTAFVWFGGLQWLSARRGAESLQLDARQRPADAAG
jgi:N-acetylglucosaminyldiphosphoundecaprenol N-acetyl-beta-D-mannosaminyltransferase